MKLFICDKYYHIVRVDGSPLATLHISKRWSLSSLVQNLVRGIFLPRLMLTIGRRMRILTILLQVGWFFSAKASMSSLNGRSCLTDWRLSSKKFRPFPWSDRFLGPAEKRDKKTGLVRNFSMQKKTFKSSFSIKTFSWSSLVRKDFRNVASPTSL